MEFAVSSTDPLVSSSAIGRNILGVSSLDVEELLAVLEPSDDVISLAGGSYLLAVPGWRTHLATAIEEAVTHHRGRVIRNSWPALWTDDHTALGAGLDPPLRAAFIGGDDHQELAQFAARSAVPVINATTDREQPIHVLADLLTIHDLFGRLRGLRVAFVGGPSCYRRSLVEAAARIGLELVLTQPAPDAELVALLDDNASFAQLFGGSLRLADPAAGVIEVDVVLGDPIPFALLATTTHLPLHLTGAAAESGASTVEGPRSLLFHRQENLQRVVLRLLELVGATAARLPR